MATLEKIRSKAALLVIVVGVALFAFIIGDFLRSGSTFFRQNQENIVTVNGESIRYHDFQAKVEERTNELKGGNSNRSFTEDEQNQIRQMVLNESIDEILFQNEAQKLGLTVSKDEYKDLVMGNNVSPILTQIPDFQNPQTRRFDKNILLQFLQTIESDDFENYPQEMLPRLMEMKKAWLNIENQIQQTQLRQKFNVLVASAILINDLDAKAIYEDNKTSVDFAYVAQAYNTVPDADITVSDAEIQKLYNERKSQYKQPEAKVIDYIAYPIVPDPADYQLVETKLNTLKEQLTASDQVAELIQGNSEVPYINAYVAYTQLNENLKQFVSNNPVGTVEGPVLTGTVYNLYKLEGEKTAPDSVKLNAIMLPATMSDTEVKHLTDSLTQVVKSGTAFKTMASTLSGGQTNGELGWETEAQLAAQVDALFKDEVFNAPVNEPVVIKSNVGAFLVQVTEKTRPVKKYKIANVQEHVIASQDTKTRLYNNLSQFISTNHSLTALKEKAAAEGFNLQSDVEITKEQIGLNGIQGSRKVIQWVWNNKKGAISDIEECQNAEFFVVAAIENQLPEGFRPLTSVSELLKRELINGKKGEKLTADLKAKNFSSLEQYAEAMSASIDTVKFVTFATANLTGIGIEPVLNVEAPLAALNKVSGPYAGKNRVYVIDVVNKRESSAPFNAELQKKQMQMQNSYRTYQLMQSPELLRESAKIDNNFNRFF